MTELAKRDSLIADVTNAVSVTVRGTAEVIEHTTSALASTARIAANTAAFAEAKNLAWVAEGYADMSDEEIAYIRLIDPDRVLPARIKSA